MNHDSADMAYVLILSIMVEEQRFIFLWDILKYDLTVSCLIFRKLALNCLNSSEEENSNKPKCGNRSINNY